MADRLKDKVALITGAASGIGLATLELFVAEGARVVAADLAEEDGRALEARFDGRVRFARCDVTDCGALKAAVDLAPAAFGGLDVLFSNAGRAGLPGGLAEFDPAAWDATQALLVRSVAAGAAYAAPHMRARGGGSIVNTASIAGIEAGWGPLAYSAAKAAVHQLTRVAAAELARDRIRVNAVAPGFIATRIFGDALGMDRGKAAALAAEVERKSAVANPIGRAGLARDIAEAVLYLASDASGFVTGTHLVVDGGVTAGPRHAWDLDTPSPMQHALGITREMAEQMRAAARAALGKKT